MSFEWCVVERYNEIITKWRHEIIRKEFYSQDHTKAMYLVLIMYSELLSEAVLETSASLSVAGA